MIISVDISYNPLIEHFNTQENTFIQEILNKEDITIEKGEMSSIITGDFTELMNLLSTTMGGLMKKYPSVFTIKISDFCMVS